MIYFITLFMLILLCKDILSLKSASEIRIKMDEEILCSACELLADEMDRILNDEYLMDKTIKIGHRLKTGQFGAGKYIKYARSETRIIEIMNDVCEDSSWVTNKATATIDGRKQFVDTTNMKNGMGSYDNFKLDGTEGSAIQKICFDIVEDEEEHMISYLKDNFAKDLQLRDNLCGAKGIGYCDWDTNKDLINNKQKRRKRKSKRKKKE